MTGRGVDQVMPHPSSPQLYEPCIRDARGYVELAERANGPILRPIGPEYIWGDALHELRHRRVDLRVINLETSITTCDDAWPNKGINYRMHPRNIGCITSAGIDVCCLANNHVLDWGFRGLIETLEACEEAALAHPGAGRNAGEAAAPAVRDVPGKGRVLVFAVGSTTSGIPCEWAATEDQPGINVLADLSDATARSLAAHVRRFKRAGDVAIVSIHWGGNWGYSIPAEQIRFARLLIDEGADIVHGHSSHHAKAVEIYRDRLILYGCGDLIDDYEGISGHEQFRNDLKVMYVATFDAQLGRLTEARLVPMQIRNFRLHRASPGDAHWMCDLMTREGKPFGTRAELQSDESILLHRR